jgi:ABC-2 type transport system permease protein
VILPAGLDAALQAGSSVAIEVLADPANSAEQAAAATVASVVADQGSRVQAAVFATEQASGTVQENVGRAATVEPGLARIGLDARQVQTRPDVLPEGFRYSAPTMLVLFVFLNALAGGAIIVENRRSGMYERMAAAPIRAWTIVEGEALTYVGIAVIQSVLIVGLGALVFGVSWGNPLAASALIAVWAVIGAGAGLLSGTLFRTPEQATSIGPVLGIALGMLGGCMWPLSIVTNFMRQLGHATPQAWAIDGWTAVLARHAGITSISRDLAVLAVFAVAFLGIASLRLRRALG